MPRDFSIHVSQQNINSLFLLAFQPHLEQQKFFSFTCCFMNYMSSLPTFNCLPFFPSFSNALTLFPFASTGSRIITVRARDDDRDNITYGLEPSLYYDGSAFFSINPRSGDVFLKESLQGKVWKETVTPLHSFNEHVYWWYWCVGIVHN